MWSNKNMHMISRKYWLLWCSYTVTQEGRHWRMSHTSASSHSDASHGSIFSKWLPCIHRPILYESAFSTITLHAWHRLHRNKHQKQGWLTVSWWLKTEWWWSHSIQYRSDLTIFWLSHGMQRRKKNSHHGFHHIISSYCTGTVRKTFFSSCCEACSDWYI